MVKINMKKLVNHNHLKQQILEEWEKKINTRKTITSNVHLLQVRQNLRKYHNNTRKKCTVQIMVTQQWVLPSKRPKNNHKCWCKNRKMLVVMMKLTKKMKWRDNKNMEKNRKSMVKNSNKSKWKKEMKMRMMNRNKTKEMNMKSVMKILSMARQILIQAINLDLAIQIWILRSEKEDLLLNRLTIWGSF